MDHLGGCPLANNDRGDISVLGLGIAPHAGLGGIANGNIGFGGCPCSDGAMGFAGTPRASLGGAADVRLGLSGAPRASLDSNTASGNLSLSGCPLPGHDGRGRSSMVACGGKCSLVVGRGMSNLVASSYTFHLVPT